MSPRRERSPEKSAPMIAQKCRSMEVSEAAGAGTNRQHFSMERGFGEAQGRASTRLLQAALGLGSPL